MSKRSTVALVVAGLVSIAGIIVLIVVKNSVKRSLEKKKRLERSIKRQQNWSNAERILQSENLDIEKPPDRPVPLPKAVSIPTVHAPKEKTVTPPAAQKTKEFPKEKKTFRPTKREKTPVVSPSCSSINGIPVSEAIGVPRQDGPMCLDEAIEKAVGSVKVVRQAGASSISFQNHVTSEGPIMLGTDSHRDINTMFPLAPINANSPHFRLLMDGMRMAELLVMAINELDDSTFEQLPADGLDNDSGGDDSLDDDDDSEEIGPVVEEILDEEDDPKISLKDATVQAPETQTTFTEDNAVTMSRCEPTAQQIKDVEIDSR